MMHLLYCDNVIAVCEKPAGCLAEAGSEKNLPALLQQTLRDKGEADPVFTVHRLDREVGGLTVLGRTHEAASKLIEQFGAHQIDKEYYAVLKGVPEQAHAVWEDLLFRDAANNKTYVVKRTRKGVREAKLEYRVLETTMDEGQPISLVRIRLFTGRTHQIRAQFSARKLPLIGDGRYGGKDRRCSIALFSCVLGFNHPETGRRMRFYQRPDLTQFPWNQFSRDAYLSISPFSTELPQEENHD